MSKELSEIVKSLAFSVLAYAALLMLIYTAVGCAAGANSAAQAAGAAGKSTPPSGGVAQSAWVLSVARIVALCSVFVGIALWYWFPKMGPGIMAAGLATLAFEQFIASWGWVLTVVAGVAVVGGVVYLAWQVYDHRKAIDDKVDSVFGSEGASSVDATTSPPLPP